MGLRIARNEHLRIVRVDRWCRNIDRLHTCISAGRGQAALKWTIAFMLVTFSTHAIEAQTNPPSEYQIEAAFLFNFAKFIDWPTNGFADPHSFAICVLGGMGSFAGTLVAAIILGIMENMTATFFGPSWAPAVAFGFLLLTLAIRPSGIFGRA